MIQHKDHFHGSDLEKIEQIYHIPKEQITSFSANVNLYCSEGIPYLSWYFNLNFI